MLQDAKQRLSSDEYRGFEQIYAFSKQHASEIRFGTGAYGTFIPIFGTICERSLFTLSTDKRLIFNFEWMEKRLAELFKEKLETIGFSFLENYKESKPSVLPEEWLPKTSPFLHVIEELLS